MVRPSGLEATHRPEQPSPSPAAAKPAPGAELTEGVAQGRARFRDRFEAHRRQQAEQAANEAGARDLVARWDQAMTGSKAALPRLDTDPAYGAAREALLGFAKVIREQPGSVAVLRERGEAFGMGERPNLTRVLADARPERVVSGIVSAAETGMRARLQEQAQQRAVQEAARRQELASRPQQTPRRGPSLGR